jgi:DNA-directed RNA polymerase specialized sigma24 family protein
VAADQALLQRLCDGQATAWRQLLELWSPRLYSYVFYNTHSDADAQVLLQKAFALVVQRVMHGTQRPQSSSALSVLLVATVYRSIMQYQQQMGVPALDAARYLQAFDRTHQHFIAALRELAPIVQQLLLLRYLVSLSINELALVTGYSASAVAVIVRAATQHFPPTTLR